MERALQVESPLVVVVMGVAGSGKSTVGRGLVRRFGWRFQKGDALHPPANVAKMRAGHALDDNDRAPWLAAVAPRMEDWRGRGESGVVTCSALKPHYRQVVIDGRQDVRLVYLYGARSLLAERIAGRRGHFMPASLPDSQLATLERPGPEEHAIEVAVDAPVAAIV